MEYWPVALFLLFMIIISYAVFYLKTEIGNHFEAFLGGRRDDEIDEEYKRIKRQFSENEKRLRAELDSLPEPHAWAYDGRGGMESAYLAAADSLRRNIKADTDYQDYNLAVEDYAQKADMDFGLAYLLVHVERQKLLHALKRQEALASRLLITTETQKARPNFYNLVFEQEELEALTRQQLSFAEAEDKARRELMAWFEKLYDAYRQDVMRGRRAPTS